jgi:hypothetical protein
MTDTTITRFKIELNSFFGLVLLNMVFGALAMAFGMQCIIANVLGLAVVQTLPALRILAGAISLAVFGLGLYWVLASAKILKGITAIRRESRGLTGPVPDETLTGWIIGMTSHYREKRQMVLRMITICRLGGCVFLTVGIVTLIQLFSSGAWAGNLGIAVVALSLVAAAINLTIGLASIIFSLWFHRYATAWDRRLDEAAQNEAILKKTLGQD